MANYYVDPVSGSDTTGNGLTDGTAWQTLQHALNNISRFTWGDQINLKSGGANVLTGNLDCSTYAPNTLAQLKIRGYGSTANDGSLGTIDGDGSYRINQLSNTTLIDLEIRNGPTGDTVTGLTNYSRLINCYIHTCPRSAIGTTDEGTAIVSCRFENIQNQAVRSHGSSLLNCYFSNGADYSFTTTVGITISGLVKNCIFNLGGSSTGVQAASGGHSVTNNTFFGDGSGLAYLTLGDYGRGAVVAENIITGFGTGVGNYSNNGIVLRNNTFLGTIHSMTVRQILITPTMALLVMTATPTRVGTKIQLALHSLSPVQPLTQIELHSLPLKMSAA
jgi:hypothetical protein